MGRSAVGLKPEAGEGFHCMPISQELLERIETFRRNRESYLNPEYRETRARLEFIDPFFEALGWDMTNQRGYAEAYKDVVHEDSLRISGVGTSAPDYSFRVGGARKFFVEAKKPAIPLKDDPEPALQLRRYSWSAKLALGIVTNFQEFAVYDTRIRPSHGDKASAGRILYATYEDYPGRWDEIAGIVSRDAVLRGSFDKYAFSSRGKRGTAEFDDDFLADLEKWRKQLAENLAVRNKELGQRDLNFAVQRILDRIIFLRIAEERGIENFGQLFALTAGPRIYPRLCEIFGKADLRYNSGLFHFENEAERHESADRLTLGLTVDDSVLKEIISSLYYPRSPYAFSVVPADTLGHVYEQFLGKVIYLTEGHHARIAEKPEVRKAGGVYYTPTYIVNYIVAQTIGPLVAGRSLRQVEKLRVLDPACGSGSFLLGAYEFLLDWHLKYYLDHDPEGWAKKKTPPIYETSPNAAGMGRGPKNWQLTSFERKRILTNNLYGVDIDAQAVEVTKLSLLLKVLEGEARELQQLDFHRALPDLGDNIKCGNSLIGSDFYAQTELPAIDDEARYKINAFDWQHEFGAIMAAGGFDAVIGNPPYVRPHNLGPDEKKYYWQHYPTFTHKADLYCCFIEKGGQLLRPRGRLAYIVSNGWLRLNSFQALRRHLLDFFQIEELVELPFKVFKDAQVTTGIFVVQRNRAAAQHCIAINRATPRLETATFAPVKRIPQRTFEETFQNVFDISIEPATENVKQRMRGGPRIGDHYQVCFGLKSGDDSRFLHHTVGLHKEDRPLLRGENVKRYATAYAGEFVYYVPEKMRAHRRTARPGEPWRFEQPKVLVKDTSTDFGCTYDAAHYYVKDVLIVVPKEGLTPPVPLPALCGILNSKLLKFYYRTTFPTLHVQSEELASLPLPREMNSAAISVLAGQVERMLRLHAELVAAKAPEAQDRVHRDIAATERTIDQLVFQLYGLQDEEVSLVERVVATASEPTNLVEQTG